MDYPESYKNIVTGRAKLDDWLKSHYNEFYDYLIHTYADCNIKESLYMFYNGIQTKPTCKACGSPVKFHGYSYGFSEFCCSKCAQNDDQVRQKLKDTNVDRYGEDYISQFISKGLQTKTEKYGSTSYNNKEKYRKTCLDRYGVENPMQSQDIKKKSMETCLERYGNALYLCSDEYNRKRRACLEKSKRTCLERYGVTCAMQSDNVKDKLKKTCLERYGVEYNCLRPEAHNSRNCNSKPNNKFEELLIQDKFQ